MAKVKVDVVTNTGPLNDLLKMFATLDEKVKSFSTQGGANLSKALSTLGSFGDPLAKMSQMIQTVNRNLGDLQQSLSSLEKMRIAKPFEELKTDTGVSSLTGQIGSLIHQIRTTKTEFAGLVATIRDLKPQQFKELVEVVSPQQIQRVQTLRKEIAELSRQEADLATKRRAAASVSSPETTTYHSQLESTRRQITSLSGQLTIEAAKLKNSITPGHVSAFLAPIEQMFGVTLKSIDSALDKVESRFERISRLAKQPIPAGRPSTIEADVGRTYTKAFVGQVYETAGSLRDTVLRELNAVFKTEEGFSKGGLEAVNEKLERRLRAVAKSVEGLFMQSDFFQIAEQIDRGAAPAQEKILKFGNTLNKLAQFAWKSVQEFGKEMGEPMVLSTGVTRVTPHEEAKVQLMKELNKVSTDLVKRWTELKERELSGADISGLRRRVDALREYKNQLVEILKFSERQGGITSVSEATAIGREVNVRTKHAYKAAGGTDYSALENTIGKLLGYEEEAADGFGSMDKQIRQSVSSSKDLYTSLTRIPELVERLRSLFMGTAAIPGQELESLLKTVQMLERITQSRAGAKIGAMDPEAMTIIEHLPQGVGKATGYVEREIPKALTTILGLISETKDGYAQLDAVAAKAFASQIKDIEILEKDFRSIDYAGLQQKAQELVHLTKTAQSDPEKYLGLITGKANLLSQELETISVGMGKVGQKAFGMSEAVDIRPMVQNFETLRSLWAQPGIGARFAEKMDADVRQFFSRFKEEGKGPINNLLILWNEIVDIVKKYDLQMAELEKKSHKLGPESVKTETAQLQQRYSGMFTYASEQLFKGFAAAEGPITNLNAFRDAFKGLAFGSRDIFNVGANASGILESVRELSQLTLQAIQHGLDASAAPRFGEMRKNIEQATLVLSSEHLPVLQKILSITTELEAMTRKYAGGSFLRVPRGQLPERLTEFYGARTWQDPYAHLGFSLEEAPFVPKGGAYQSRLQKLGDSFIESFEIIGRQLKETPGKAIFPGQLEIVDLIGKKLSTMTEGTLGYYMEQLSQGKSEILYEPSMPYLKTLRERAGIAAKATAEPASPELVSMDLTLKRTMRSLDVVIGLYDKMFALIQRGTPITAEFFQKFEASATKASSRFRSGLIEDVQAASNRLRTFLASSEYAPSAVREALKIPHEIEGRPYGLASMLQRPAVEGGKPFVQTLGVEGVARLGVALGKEMERTNEILDENVKLMLQKRIFAIQKILTTERLSLQKRGEWTPGVYKQIQQEFPEEDRPYLEAFTTLKKARAPKAGSLESIVSETQQSATVIESMQNRVAEIFRGGAESMSQGALSTQEVMMRISQMTPEALQVLIRKLRPLQKELQDALAKMFTGTRDPQAETYLQDLQAKLGYFLSSAEGSLKRAKQRPYERTTGPEVVEETLSSVKQIVSEESKIPTQLDKITTMKLAALTGQSTQMKEQMQKTKQEVKQGEQGIWSEAEIAGMLAEEGTAGKVRFQKGAPVLDRGTTKSGEPMGIDLTNALNAVINRFAELSNQFDVFGYGLSKQGKPISAFVSGIEAVRSQIGVLIKDLSKMGEVTPTFDVLAEKSLATPFSAHWDELQKLRQEAMEAAQQYRGAKHPSSDLTEEDRKVAEEGSAEALRRFQDILKRVVTLYDGLRASANALLTVENLTVETRSRELALVEELGQKYKVAQVEAKAGLASPVAPLESIEAAERLARGTLARAAFQGPESKELFSLGVPASTEADVRNKVLQEIEGNIAGSSGRFAQVLQGSMGGVFETFQKLNKEFEFGFQVPNIDIKNIEFLVRAIQHVEKQIATNGPSVSLEKDRVSLQRILEAETNDFHQFVANIYGELAGERQRLGEVKFKTGFAEEMDKAAQKINTLKQKLEGLIGASRDLQQQKAPAEVKIPAYEEINRTIVEARKAYFQAQRDVHIDQANILEPFLGTIKEAEKSQKGLLSLWDRLANTIKTSRNNLADLFMYQVRWYASMLVFWGIWNKITGVLENMMHAQFEIERATINMREYSGEVVANYDRLQKIAGPAIFEGMQRWGFTAKDAGEALYQLGSAGLSAQEALAALNPSLAMVLGTTADMRESVKTLAGLYNVLSSSMSPLDAMSRAVGLSTAAEASSLQNATQQGAKFRQISDVLTMVFRDHQVEMSELNRGYQFAISASDMAGLTFEQLSAILAVLNDNMIKSSRAGRGLSDILSHMSRDPYAVFGSFKEMALMLEKYIPTEKFKEVQKVLNSWDFSRMKDKSMFEGIGELARLINTTGINIGVLSRILESFGILGGRAIAPMLKHWYEIERETIRLSVSASGAAEMMANRMSNTLEKGLLKISAYFQNTFYDAFQLMYQFSKGSINIFSKWGEDATTAGRAMSSGLGGGFTGNFAQGAMSAAPVVLSLAGALSMLGGVLPRVAALFPNLGLRVLFWVGSLVTAIPVLKEVTFLQNLFTAAFPGAGFLKLAIGIGTVLASFGLMKAVYKTFFEDIDSLVASSEKSWADYNAETSKGAQKQKEAWAQASYITQTRRALDEATKGMKDNDTVTDELSKKYKLYAVSVGATEEQEKRRLPLLKDLKAAMAELGEAQTKALKQAEDTSLYIANSTSVEKLYIKAMTETAEAIKRVREELDALEKAKKAGVAYAPGYGAEVPMLERGYTEAERKQLESRKKFLEFTGKSTQETELRGARERLLDLIMATSPFSPEAITKFKQTAEGSEKGYVEAIDMVGTAFNQGYESLSKRLDKEALTQLLFPADTDVMSRAKKFEAIIGEWSSKSDIPGSIYLALYGRLAEVKQLPLGPELGKKVAEDIHTSTMARINAEIAESEHQLQINKERIIQAQLTKASTREEIQDLFAKNDSIERTIEAQKRGRIEAERAFQERRLLTGSEKDAAKMNELNAKAREQQAGVDLQRLQKQNEQQRQYQQMIEEWMKRTLPTLREKAISQSLQPGGIFGLAPGAGKESVSQIFDAMKPAAGVTQEKLQQYLNILGDQAKSFGYGPKAQKLFAAIMAHESRFVEGAESPKGAQGLMQIMPENLRTFGIPEALWKDPLSNIRVGVRMLSDIDAEFKLGLKDIEKLSGPELTRAIDVLVSAYNAGSRRASQALSRGMTFPEWIPETTNMVADVKRRFGLLQPMIMGSGDAIKGNFDKWMQDFYSMLTVAPKGAQAPASDVVKKILESFLQQLPETLPGAWEGVAPNIRTQFLALAQKVGVEWNKLFKLTDGEIQKQLEAGHIVSPEAVDQFFENQRKLLMVGSKKLFGEREIREMGLKFIQSLMVQDVNWKPETFEKTLDLIFKIGENAGITRTKVYNMITTGLNPELMKEVLRGNEQVTVEFFQKFMKGFERYSYVPSKMYALWESAIVEMLQIGDVFSEKTLRNWAEILKALPVKKLTEDAAAFAKYFTLLAARQDIKTSDLKLMSDLMRQFGASADEIWKAFGEVADQQIRRIRANWYEAGSGLKNDLKEAATLGDAMWWSMVKGISEFASKIRDPFKMLADSISGTLETMRGTLEEILTDFGMRQPKTMQEYMNKMAEGFTKTGAKNLSEQIMGGFTDLLAGAFGIPSELLAGMKSPQQQASEYAKKTATSTERTAIATEAMANAMGAGIGGIGESLLDGSTGSLSSTPSSTPGGLPKASGGGDFSFYNIPVIGPIVSMFSSLFSGIGKWFGFRHGGFVPGFGSGDIVPAMLEPGEFVVPRSVTKRFQEGGGVELDPEIMQSMVGDMVGQMFEPYKEMLDPSKARYAQIGEGYYGTGFEKQMQFQAYMDQAYQMDFQRKMSQSNMETQAYIQSVLSQPSGLQMGLNLFKGLMSFPFGVFGSGGLVSHFSSGGLQGPMLTPRPESERSWQYANPRMVSVDETKKQGGTWLQSLLSITGGLLGPLVLMNKMFGGAKTPTVGKAAASNSQLFETAMASADRNETMANLAQSKIDLLSSQVAPFDETSFFGNSMFGGAEGMAAFFGGFANGGIVPKWAAKYAAGTSVQKYFPTSGPGSSTAANFTYSQAPNTSAVGSYLPAILFALLPLLLMGMKMGKPKTAAAVPQTTPEAVPGQEDVGFFSKIWGGIKNFFGFQEGGSVGWFDWLGPSQAFAMPPSEILPSLASGWESGLNKWVTQGLIPEHQGAEALTQAKLGVQDVVSFMKDKPFFFDPITKLAGNVSATPGGGAFPASGAVDINLSPYTSNMEQIRSDIANYVMHESVHVLSKEGQPLAPWNVAVDPKVAFEWAQKAYPNSPAAWKQYVSEPGEVVARGVTAHLQSIMNPNYSSKMDWPQEYDAMFKQLATGLAKGELPIPPTEPGFMEKVGRSIYEITKVGRYPTDASRFFAGYQTGGQIPGLGHGDTVPAWLTPGEFVVNRGTVDFFGPHFFQNLQEMAREQKIASIAHVAQAAQQAQRYAQGGVVKKGPSPTTSTSSAMGTTMQGAAATSPEVKMTVVTVVDDSSLDQFLNTKKYGDVLVNKLGSRISRRMSGGRAV